ncbi:MAG: hypothetical protein GY754_45150 [bacterium]|nr:hypothetical protein [bacterium]
MNAQNNTGSKPVIKLKDFSSANTDSLRIFSNTQKAVENLNIYAADFFESIAILSENREKSLKKNDHAKAEEITENILFVETKIKEVTESMQKIAAEMPFLVEFEYI